MFLEKVNSPDDLKRLTLTELKVYAKEVRDFLIETVTKTGGHLASNLGIVELTVALHYVFDCPKDKFLFDVGHQSYVHKMITGRLAQMQSLRMSGGLSGFPSPEESDADVFMTGHSSTSISLALGLARARDLAGDDYNILSVIGDGSFTGGMVYEALNDIGETGTKLIIILNDNKMSISKNVGAISKYFTKLRLSRKYNIFRANIKKTLTALPFFPEDGGVPLKKAKTRVKEFFLASRLFENFGISYYGPIDGHNISELIDTFKRVSLKKHPSIIHLVTKKGKGYPEAEANPDKFHGISASVSNAVDSLKNTLATDVESVSSEILSDIKSIKSFSNLAGNCLSELAQGDEKIVAVTAAMGLGTGLDEFAKKFPKRYFDVSIAEPHAVSVSAGLAKGGFKPYFFVYSTFLQRGFDQILHEVSLNDLPVRFLVDRAGAIGSDGSTHQGVFDLSYVSMIPGLTIMTPKDGAELAEMIKWSVSFSHPLIIRYPKDYALDFNHTDCIPIEYGKWEIFKNNDSNIFLLAAGSRMMELASKIKNSTIINVRFVKPLDIDLFDKINKKGNLIITLEDNVFHGGFGQAVVSYLNNVGLNTKVINFAHGDKHLKSRGISDTLKESNITEKDVLNAISHFLENKVD